MAKKGALAHSAALVDCWRRWTAIVELFAFERPERKKVEEGSYRKLHAELLAQCHASADWDDNPHRALYQKLEYLARPWLNTETFERGEQEILSDLLQRCRQAEQELTGSKARSSMDRRLVWSLAVGLGVFAAVWLMAGRWLPFWEWIQGSVESIQVAARGLSRMQLGLVFAGLLVIVAIMITWRSGHT
jgi:hypothetical protein